MSTEYRILAYTAIIVGILVSIVSCQRAEAIQPWIDPADTPIVVYVEVPQDHAADECFEDEVYWWVTDQGYRQCQPLDDIIGLHIEWLIQNDHLRWIG